MELNGVIVSIATFLGGIIGTKLVERYFEKKHEAEDKMEATEAARLEQLERTVRSMELTLATLMGKLELILPNVNAIGKLKEDLAGFYSWMRSNQGEKK